MFQRKTRRFRRRSNGRNHLGHGHGHGNGHSQMRQRPNSFSNSQPRNNFRSTQSAEKLFEKYSALAKEAISSGDKTLGENYLQHADHFMRIIEDKNKNKDHNKINVVNKQVVDSSATTENNTSNATTENNTSNASTENNNSEPSNLVKDKE